MKIPKKIKPWLTLHLTILSGASLPLAFAPFNLPIFAFLSPLLLLFFLAHTSIKQSFWRGWQYGFGLFAVGSSWIYVSIHDFGHTNLAIAVTITILFIVILACFYGAMAATLAALSPQNGFRRAVLAFPALWVSFEMLRGWLLTGFPWLYLGYSQLKTHLMHYAPIGSVFLVSFAVILIVGIIYYFIFLIIKQHKNITLKIFLLFLFLAIWLGGYFLDKKEYTVAKGQPLTVALAQGNVPQFLRWDPNALDHIIETYEKLTTQNLDADVIIWPESAIPLALPYSSKLYEAYDLLAKNTQTALIVSVPEKVEGKDAYYLTLKGIGLADGEYRKKRLVPFGEYVPLEKYLRGIIGFFDLPMSKFIANTKQDPITAFNYQFGPAICYEIAYPLQVRDIANQSDILVTVSNDTWFGRSIGPDQHLQIAQFRALETGRYLARATNTGLTAIVDPEGKILQLAPQFEETVLRGSVFPMAGRTPWMQWGIWPLVVLLATFLVIALFTRPHSKVKKKKRRH